MNAILLALAGVIILLVGGGAGFWFGRSGVGGSKAKVEKAEAELEEYKRNVTEHFGQTAAQFQTIGKQYRELYEHMANGAQTLCEPDEAGMQLLFAPGSDAVTTDAEEPTAEPVVEAVDCPPTDYAESPVATEATDASEAAEEAADEQVAETDVTEGSVAESAAESQTKTEAGDQTVH